MSRRTHEIHVTRHAVERFQQRVAHLSMDRSMAAVQALADSAKARSRPRHWMADTTAHLPGTTYLYNSRLPDVCLIVRNGSVITIFTRDACRRWRDDRDEIARPSRWTHRPRAPIGQQQRGPT